MANLVLITGGAGFIGQKLAARLISAGISVRILDNFNPQIHSKSELPSALAKSVDLIRADIRDAGAIKHAMNDVDCLVHLAAETGTGQSMYEISRYFDVNVQGTAAILEYIQNIKPDGLRNIVIASSRAVYGEGSYFCGEHKNIFPGERLKSNMCKQIYEPSCPICGAKVSLLPTSEASPFMPMSVYGLTKQVQEQATLMVAKNLGINAFALRYQNVYGPGQSLKNPYTGILAVFSNLARQNKDIEIYEDGLESRDFVYIDDVVDATMGAINYVGEFNGALNVGSGISTNVIKVATEIKKYFKSSSQINVTGDFRIGDIRHNIADITKIKKLLDFSPKFVFENGLKIFLDWATSQEITDISLYLKSISELQNHGLMGNFKK